MSIDLNELPTELFTTNQWVTDEWLYPASAVVPLLDAFDFPSTRETSLAARWLGALVALFRPQIARLLLERDRILLSPGKAGRHRRREILSRVEIDIDDRLTQLAPAGHAAPHDRQTLVVPTS